MTDLFTYRTERNWKARSTSRQAAEQIAPRAGTLREKALICIQQSGSYGMTADEVAAKLGIDRLAIRPRLSELARMGLIRDTGRTHPNASGKQAVCWSAE